MTEIVGGLEVKDLMEGGAEFEVRYQDQPEDENDDDYLNELALHTKMECLDFGNSYDGQEPFDKVVKKMRNLLPSGKIKKRIIREGYGSNPDPLNNVKVHYNAYVQYEAHPFDSTYTRKKPFSFDLGDGQVIEGLDLAVKSMKINEKSQFLIDSEYAYRSSGLNRVPPNSTVLFEVELVGIMNSQANSFKETDKDFPHVYEYCLGQCVKGKRLFRLMDYHGAIKEYNIAVEKLEEVVLNNYEEQLKSDELLVRLYTNLLICYTHVQLPKKACVNVQKLYNMAKDKTFKISAKIYYNHAKCLRMLGDFARAEQKLQLAKRLEPKNPEILQEFLAIRKAAEEYKKKMTAMGKALVN